MPSVSRQVADFQGRIEGVARVFKQQLTDYQKDKEAADKLLTIGAFKAKRNSTTPNSPPGRWWRTPS